MMADRATIVSFLNALSRREGDWLDALEEAGLEAFPDHFCRSPSGVAVRDGSTVPVRRVLELLAISDADAEIVFTHLPDDPKVLAAYLRPRVVGGDGWVA